MPVVYVIRQLSFHLPRGELDVISTFARSAPISHYCIEARRRGWLFGYAGYGEAALARAARAVGQRLR